ncbi:MAG: 30S ribosome-binding factor RbfA [Bacteroidales bacterium]|nr:30S ribosome-binding factor RbfA [Bacteroidales bacterium]
MEGESTRQLKVARQLQRDIAEIIRAKGMATFQGALVSVSGVKISPDLAVAKVYISIFPSNKQQAVLQIVQDMGKSIRGELGRLVAKQLRIVPELIFCLDDSLDYVERIDELLSK